jgi:hypothetical protein
MRVRINSSVEYATYGIQVDLSRILRAPLIAYAAADACVVHFGVIN